MELQKLTTNVNERRGLLHQLADFNDLMEEAIKNGDLERYEKVERDFNYLAERFEYVGKRS